LGKRYSSGENSGAGSYGRLAEYKAAFLNHFMETNDVNTVLELGCGDGNQLTLLNPKNYIGYDVSQTIIAKCRESFSEHQNYEFYGPKEKSKLLKCDLAVSLDVIFHLVEDDVYESYIDDLFSNSDKYVIIYSSDIDYPWGYAHVRHRNFSRHVAKTKKEWSLKCVVKNPYPYDSADTANTSFCDFYVFSREDRPCVVSCLS